MVVQGRFSLQLVDAESHQSLNEYCGLSGAVYYAEAQQQGEYFLRFQVLPMEDDTSDNTQKEEEVFYFRPSVDGKDLGFYTNLTASQGARDVGLWTFVNGVGTNRALQFDIAAASEVSSHNKAAAAAVATGDEMENPSSSPPPMLYMGNVQVQISKAVPIGTQRRIHSKIPSLTEQETVLAETPTTVSASSSLNHEDTDETAGANGNGHQESKTPDEEPITLELEPVPVLRSREGGARWQCEFSQECLAYQPGELLETITIHYGSRAALQQAGVLMATHPMASGGTEKVPQFVTASPPEAASKSAAPSQPVVDPTAKKDEAKPSSNSPPPIVLTAGLVPNPLAALALQEADQVTGSVKKRPLDSNTAADASMVKKPRMDLDDKPQVTAALSAKAATGTNTTGTAVLVENK